VTSHPPDPVKHARDTPELRQLLERACAERGLSASGARLIHRYSNAVYLLPKEQAVARITSGSLRQADRAHAVTGWLVEHCGVAATRALDEDAARPGCPVRRRELLGLLPAA
jgi:hypothetical protein